MKLEQAHRNSIVLELATGERLIYSKRYWQSGPREFCFPPPLPLQCVIGRLLNDCYYTWKTTGNEEGVRLELVGYSPIGGFERYELAAGEEAFIDLRHLAGILLPQDDAGSLRPLLSGIFRPAMWVIGHPIPAIAKGPMTIFLYGQALVWKPDGPEKKFQTSQVVAFGARDGFSLYPSEAQGGAVSMLFNALSTDTMWATRRRILVENFIKPREGGMKLFRHFLGHMFLFLMIYLIWVINKPPG